MANHLALTSFRQVSRRFLSVFAMLAALVMLSFTTCLATEATCYAATPKVVAGSGFSGYLANNGDRGRGQKVGP